MVCGTGNTFEDQITVEGTMIGTDYMSLNLKYDRTLRKLWLSQTGFIWKLLKMHNLVTATWCNTPMIANHAFTTGSQPDELILNGVNCITQLFAMPTGLYS